MSNYGAGFDGRSRHTFAPSAIVIDPQVPHPVKEKLRGQPADGELLSFRDPRADVPRPPRSQAAAARIASAAGVLVVVSVIAGLLAGAAAFAVFFVLGLAAAVVAARASAAAREGRPALASGLIPLPPASDLTDYYVTYAARIFHRRYVCPKTDLDPDALTAWERAVDAANRVYRADSMRQRVVDADRVTAEVPELLWKIAEGLAKISDVRFDLKQIVPGAERFHPAVEAKMKAQERDLARGTSQVNRRIDRLETVASRLEAADAARRDEALLMRLREVDPKIRDLVASTDESITEIDAAESLKLDVEAIVEMTNQAIMDLSAGDEDDEPGGDADDDPGGDADDPAEMPSANPSPAVSEDGPR